MAFALLYSGTANRGELTFCGLTNNFSSDYVVRLLEFPIDIPVPAFNFVRGFSDTFNASEFIHVETHNAPFRNSYWYIQDVGSEVWLYVEKRCPIPPPYTWEVWQYTSG